MPNHSSTCILKRLLNSFLFLIILFSLLQFNASANIHNVQAGTVATGYSEYYIPGAVDQLLNILYANDNYMSSSDTLRNIITISVASDRVNVYYDQWENGYSTGAAGDETDGANVYFSVNRGDIVTFESQAISKSHTANKAAGDCSTKSITITHRNSTKNTYTGTNCFDGRDRIYVVGGAVSVAQVFWPQSAGTVYANAWEIYPVKPEETTYTIPMGIDMAGISNSFSHAYVLVEATNPSTTNVKIDDPKVGSVGSIEVNANLTQGGVTQLYNIHSGTTVTADHPVQVQFLVGNDVSHYDSRSYTAVPTAMWGHEYYNPVPSTVNSNTNLFIYNPNSAAITINYQDGLGTGSFTVPAYTTVSYSAATAANHFVPGYGTTAESGVYLGAADGASKFWAIGSYDDGSSTYNWGYSLIPSDQLTDEYYISWAPGTTNLAGNGSPIYVTPANDNTTIYVDYSPLNSTGAPEFSTVLNRTQIVKLSDPDNDNTGMHVWATGPIAIVYGEDSVKAQAGSPYIDAGYTILPLNEAWIDVVQETLKSANPSEIPYLGSQTVTFTLQTYSYYLLDRVDVKDDLPAGWSYVNYSTVITYPDPGGASIRGVAANPVISGQTLTWSNVTRGSMALNGRVKVQFQAISPPTPVAGDVVNRSQATATMGGQTFTSTASTMVSTLPLMDLVATKTHSNTVLDNWIYQGGSFDWNIEVKNIGTGGSATFSAGPVKTILTDNLPSGPTYSLGTIISNGVTGAPRCSLLGNVLTCDNNGLAVTIPATASFTVPVHVVLDTTFTGLLANPASGGTNKCMVDPNNAVNEGSANENNNNCADLVAVYTKPNLTVTKSNDVSGVITAGNPFHWALTIHNAAGTGPATFTDGQTILSDFLPSGPSYDDVTVTSTVGVRGPLRCQITSDVLTCDANGGPVTIPSGDSFSVRFGVNTNSPASLTNPSGGICKVNPSDVVPETNGSDNACAANTVTVNPKPDLTASNTNNVGGSLNLPGSFKWTVAVQNTPGTSTANFVDHQVLLIDALPTGPVYDSMQINQSSGTTGTINCSINSNTLTCTADGAVAIPPGESFETVFRVTPSSAGSLFSPTGGLLRADPDNVIDEGNETNNDAADTVTVTAPNLTAVLTDDTSSIWVLGNPPFNWTVTVSNLASGSATFSSGQAILMDSLPSGATYGSVVSVTTAGGMNAANLNCQITGSALTCAASGGEVTIPSGGSFDVSFGVTPTAPGSLTNPDSGGINKCQVDPNNVITSEVSEADNNCTDTVTVLQKVTIGDKIWLDSNANGVQDASETSGVAGVKVDLMTCGTNGVCGDGDDVIVSMMTTVAGGAYSFSADPGTYYLRVTAPVGYFFSPSGKGAAANDSDPNPATGRTASITLTSGQTENTLDAGLYQQATIGDKVWFDANFNGVQDAGEPGLEDVTIRLKTCGADTICENGDDLTIGTQVTASDGAFGFANLTPGSYYLEFSAPIHYAFSPMGSGTPATDSDVDPMTGQTGVFTLTSAQIDTTLDAGLYQNTIISGRAWTDTDASGAQNGTETGIQDITVTLHHPGPDHIPGTADDPTSTVLTDANGDYTFINIPNGNYRIVVTPPAGHQQTGDPDGTVDNQTDISVLDADVTGQNFGYQPVYTISGTVWDDSNANGLRDGESGIQSVIVELYRPGSDGTFGTGDDISVTSVNTSSSGDYTFTGLISGSYRVQVTQPDPFWQTADPDASIDNQTDLILVDADIDQQDFGYQQLSSIAGSVQQPDSTPVSGVTIRLFGPGSDGILGTVDDALLDSIITDLTGAYSFTDLIPDSYWIVKENPSSYKSESDVDGGNLDQITVNDLGEGQNSVFPKLHNFVYPHCRPFDHSGR